MANYSFHVLKIARIIFYLVIAVPSIAYTNVAILNANSSIRLEYPLLPGAVCMMTVTKESEDETLNWKTKATASLRLCEIHLRGEILLQTCGTGGNFSPRQSVRLRLHHIRAKMLRLILRQSLCGPAEMAVTVTTGSKIHPSSAIWSQRCLAGHNLMLHNVNYPVGL